MDKLTEQPIKKKIRNFITLNSVTKDEIRQEYNEIFDKLKEYEDKQEWISVEERLPSESDEVLVYRPYSSIRYAVYVYLGDNRWEDERGYIEYTDEEITTHWMPLPQPPKMKGAE